MARFSKQEDTTIRAMAARGCSINEISEHLGRHSNSVRKRVKALGVATRGKPGPKTEAPALPVERPKLCVVTNDNLLIADWLKRNGGPRRFEQGFSTDYLSLKVYLEKHGVILIVSSNQPFMRTAHGWPRKVTWAEVYRCADKFRAVEGKTPILRGAA